MSGERELISTLKLPNALQERVGALLQEPAESSQILREELDEYLTTARKSLPSGSRQRGLAESVATRMLELLNSQVSPDGLRLAQAALKYLVQEDDLQPDFDSSQGLDDDAQVFNAVAVRLGRADLVLNLHQDG